MKNSAGIWRMVMWWLCCTDAPAVGRGLRQPALPRSFAFPLGRTHFHHLSLAALQNGSFKSHLLSASVRRGQITSQKVLKNETLLLDQKEDENASGH